MSPPQTTVTDDVSSISLTDEIIADHAACIALDLRKTLDTVALDIALMIEAPEGRAIDLQIENALLKRLSSLLGQNDLQVSDLTPEHVQQLLRSTLTPE